MPDNPIIDTGERRVNEAVCIDTKRIFDSCVSKDCLEDLRVTFFSRSQRLIDDAVTIKTRDCAIEEVSIDVEEVPFNRGFYSVDITFYFKLCFDTYAAPCTTPQVAIGFAQFNKKCILYGSDGDVKVFVSNPNSEALDCPVAPQYTNPVAKVQAVDPVILSTDICEACNCSSPCCTSFPQSILNTIEDTMTTGSTAKAVTVTLGLFSIVQMERDTQILIPAYDYCIPDRECDCNTSNPCETFQSIEFPVDEFFPVDRDGSCSPCGASSLNDSNN
ncbi:MAG: hypothetical protein NC213_00620 [Acetobacter sp.]|nr:hypothetical protein [Bacteroides sp.]MCM1340230.1 hypothetical protein [Acetobacter sp.]MCM1432818.1 hypothetical protein [Clostridiales bacterium]